MSPANAEFIEWISARWPEREREGIGPDRNSICNAAAVGMVIDVWRTPVEAMHGGHHRRGPCDGEILAESVALQRAARSALASGDSSDFLSFEDRVLDRERPWAAGGRTLREMGYGHLVAFTRHVRNRTDALLHLDRIHGRHLLEGYLITRALGSGSPHWGMPLWPKIAASVRSLMLSPDHPKWRGRGSEILAQAPGCAPAADDLHRALLLAPDELPLDVLGWLADRGILMMAQSLALRLHDPGPSPRTMSGAAGGHDEEQ